MSTTAFAHTSMKVAAPIGAALIMLLLACAAVAEPIRLKLSFYGSENIEGYQYGIKPFVDGINVDRQGLLAIDVYPDGALGKASAQQARLVMEGIADIAFIAPGQTSYRFPDNELIEHPGLFRDIREGTLVYTRLVAAGALRGYQDFFVIGAYTPSPTFLHSRKPIEGLASLKGQRIRSNNPVEADALERLGAIPTVLEAPKLADAISRGAVDGAALSAAGLFQFGASKVARNHYLLSGGVAPLALVMNRKKFDALPEAAQALIRKYSGDRAAAIWIESFGMAERQFLDQLKSDPERKVVEPSPSDLQAARQMYMSLMEGWAAKSARNREFLKMAEAELAAIRSGQ